MSTIFVKNMRKDNGMMMTKAEVITQLLASTLKEGYRFADRAEECYDRLVKDGVYKEVEMNI